MQRGALLSGRMALSSRIKNALLEKSGSRCNIYLESFPAEELQVDHRVPFEIMGEGSSQDPDEYMLLCPSANRAKSWSCEHRANWQVEDAVR